MTVAFAGRIRRAALVAAAALLFAAPAAAQGVAASWSDLLPRVKAGDFLLVKDTTGKVTKGRLLEITPQALVLGLDSDTRELPATSVVEIKRRHWNDPVWTGLLIGIGAGLPASIAIGALEANEGGANALVIAPVLIGAGIGAAVDAMIPARTRIYRAGRVADIRVVPLVAPRAQGVQVRVLFWSAHPERWGAALRNTLQGRGRMSEQTCWQSVKAEGNAAFDRLKDLVREGNVRRVRVRQGERTIAEFPLTAGVVGAVFAPVLAAIGALVALMKDCTIEVERPESLIVKDADRGTPAA